MQDDIKSKCQNDFQKDTLYAYTSTYHNVNFFLFFLFSLSKVCTEWKKCRNIINQKPICTAGLNYWGKYIDKVNPIHGAIWHETFLSIGFLLVDLIVSLTRSLINLLLFLIVIPFVWWTRVWKVNWIMDLEFIGMTGVVLNTFSHL